MIDERNINNIIELIESSNQKIKTIKETIEEQKSTFELPKNDFKNLSACVEAVLKSKNFDAIQELFANLNKNITFKTDFLKEQYKNLDENIFKVQNITKHLDKDISDDVNSLVDIVETFSYKIKILQGIVGDISAKTSSFSGENPEKFLKDFRSDCGDFDEEFEQVLRELKQNFKKASDITAKLSKLDTGVDLSKELFTINVSINAIMSSIAVFDEKYKDLGKAFAESGLYTDFSAKMEDLSYNTKHLVRNIDNFNKVVEDGFSVKEQVSSLEQRLGTINDLIQVMNQEGFLEIKALLNSIDDSEDINEIKNTLNDLKSGNQNEKLDEIKEEIKKSITSFNQDEKFSELKETILSAQDNNEVLQEIKTVVANLENIKVLGQFEFILKEIHQGEKVSQEKLDELLKITSVVNFGEVEKEISFLSNDLEIILEEIKHGRSISDKSFSKLENIFESFNLMEIKNRLFEFENYLKKFLKKEDLQTFADDIQAVTEKFELANSVIIDGFDDIESLKNYVLGFEEKFSNLTKSIENIMSENQEKFDSSIEAFDNTYKIDELTNTANELMAQVTLSKSSILNVLTQGQEKIELLVKAMDSSDKFDEMQKIIKNNLGQIQNESNARIQELGEISKSVGDDMEALRASMLDVIRENQDKFDEMLESLDSKVNTQETQEKLDFILQAVEEQNNNNEIQAVSSKLMDEISNGKYLVIDTIREAQLKLEEFVASVDNSYKIEELKNITSNLQDEIFKTKDSVLNSMRDQQDRFELLIRALDDSDKIEEVNDLSKTIYSEVMASKDALMTVLKNNQLKIEEAIKLTDVNLKIDDLEDLSRKIIEEVRFAKEITQNVGRSINTEVLSDLQRSIDELKGSIGDVQDSVLAVDVKLNDVADKTDVSMIGDLVKEKHEQLEYLIRAYDPTADISAIKDNLEGLLQQQEFDELKQKLDSNKGVVYELRSILEEKTRNLELLMKSAENADEISELKDILLNIDNEQSEIKNTVDFIAKTAGDSEISSEISELKDILFTLNNEQKDIKNVIEATLKSTENTDDINYLKGILSDMDQEQKDIKSSLDYVVKVSENSENSEISGEISEIKDKLDELNTKDDLDEIRQKLDSNKDVVYELRSILEDRTRNLELLMKSVENTDDISDLKDILLNIDNEQKEIKNTVDFIAKASGDSEISSEISELKDILFTLNNEQKDIKNAIESSLKATENTDDINYLKGILSDMDQEQKDIKSSLDYVVKVSENSENSEISSDISEIKYKLDELNTKDELSEIRQKIDSNKDVVYELRSILEDRTRSLELLMKSVENTDDISDLKDVLLNIDNEQKDIKSSLDYVVKNSENSEVSGDISEIKYKLDELNTKDELSEIRQKIDSNKDVVYELRSILEDRTRNLELLMKSVENTDDISDLKDILLNIDNEQKEIKNTVDFIAKASGDSEISSEISELKDILFTLNNEQKDIKNVIEATLKSTENTDDINYLKGILSDMDQEQKDIKSSLDYVVKNSETSEISSDISEIKYKLDDLNTKNDLTELKQKIDSISEIRNDISDFSNNITSLKKELEVISSNKDIEEAVEQLENIQYVIKESIGASTSIASNISALDGKIDEIKSATDMNYDLKNLLNNIQEDQLALKALVSSMDDDETINAIKDQIKTSEYVIRDVVEANRAKEDIEQLKYQVENLTQQIVVQVMQVFDNISFEEETQEIKEFVDESHNGVKNVLSVLKTNIERLLDAPKPIYIEELRQEIEKVAQNLDSIGPEMSEYVSTITSLRVSLEELAKAKDMVNLLEQNIGNVSIEVDEILRISRDISAQFDLIYTHNEAKDDFAKIRTALDNIIEKQQEQVENVQKESVQREDLKGGIDNVNLSINYINENLNEFLGEYRIFQDRLADTMHNLEGMASTFVQSESINSEYKKGVSETFKALKKDFNSVITTVGNLYNDISQVTVLTGEMLNTSAKDKAEILQNMQALKEIVENSDIDKLKDNFSTIIFSINGFMNNVDEKFGSIIEDTKGAYEFASVNKEISENIKTSIVHILEWTNTASRDFTRIQGSIESFRDVFEESAEDIRQINEIKSIVSDLDSALASRVEEVFDRQFQNKLDNQLLPEFELLDKKIEKKLIQKLSPILEARDQDKDDLRFVINNQLSEETASLKELIDVVEKNIVVKLQNGLEQIFNQDLDFSPIVDKLDSEFSLVNDKLDDSLSKIDTELYQANVKIEDGLARINDDFSSLSSNIEDGLNQISRNVKNINFTEVNSRLEQGFDGIGQKIEDANLPQVVSKIDDEFSAMNKKLDVDFFEMNKTVVDEFNLIEEKLDNRTDTLLQNIEESNGQLASEMSQITAKIANQAEQAIGNFENIKKEIVKDVDASLDKISNKLNSQSAILKNIEETKEIISQLAQKSDSQSEENMTLVLNNLEQAKESMLYLAKNLESSQDTIGKLSSEIENQSKSFAENINSAKNDLNQEIKALANNNANSILGDISQSKDEIKLEFVQLVEKIDSQVEKLNSFESAKDEIADISGKVTEAKSELSVISGKLDAQTGLVIKNVEDSNAKLDKTLGQVTSKLENHSKTVLKSLADNQKVIEQSIGDITSKIDTQTEIVFNNLGESKVELDDISKKITAQSELMAKNIEESKEELEQELVQIIGKIDSQSENLTKAQDKKLKSFEEKLNDQEKKMQAIDEKLDILIERLNTAQSLDLSEIVIALEKRMGSLDENIKKIVSFVDEE